MNTIAIQALLASIFRHLLTLLAGALIAHRIADPEAAQGIESYADPLASALLAGLALYFSHLKTSHILAAARAFFDAQLARLESQMDHIADAKASTFAIPILPTTQNLEQPTNPKS